MTAADVATRVVKRAGLQVGKIDLDEHRLRHFTQGRQTDSEFLSAMARDNGIRPPSGTASSFAAPASPPAPAASKHANADRRADWPAC